MNRRDFLKDSTKYLSLASLFHANSATSYANNLVLNSLLLPTFNNNENVLVLIQLIGGNDGLNTIIPLDQYNNLSSLRNNILINESKVLKIKNETKIGLHPSLANIQELYNQDKICIVQGVGYPSPDFSHFRSTDIWLSGSDSNEVINSGWIGRFLDYEYPNFPNGYPNSKMSDPLAIQIGYFMSPIFQSETNQMAFALSPDGSFYDLNTSTLSINTQGAIFKELNYIKSNMIQANSYNGVVKTALSKGQNIENYPSSNDLASQLKTIAKLIHGGLKTKIYLATINGFDTHSNQSDSSDNTKGEHSTLLKTYSEAIFAFQKDLEALKIENKVIGMTFSEFGRRIISNNSFGTDHGTSQPVILFGTNVKGGIIGNNPIIDVGFDQKDNLAMQYDFRSIYSSIFEQWLCVPTDDLNSVLLKNFQSLPLINNSNCKIGLNINSELSLKQELITCTPNPFENFINITFESIGGNCLLQFFDTKGSIILNIFDKDFSVGTHNIKVETSLLANGYYYCRYQNLSLQQVKLIFKVR